jgi:hypothetical protein
MTAHLTQQELKHWLWYDKESGLFRWRHGRGMCLKPWTLAGTVTRQGYIEIHLGGRIYKAHRLAWLYMTGEQPSKEVDHINRDKSDNRWVNLRLATREENQWNASLRSDSTCGVSGVTFHKASGKWKTQCRANGKRHFLGAYKTKEEAAEAVLRFRAEHHGEFAAIRALKEKT